ncbi:TPA: cell division protein FtsA [candidate division WWE3 bacterium]|uniref:Cell division protein FtsA n=4 Tax=Katanobacteria TaxID=422282 RepID=A0A0G1KJ50_UNCKA|nr:MAG: Cell division protein ftsA [candidate division WWE3 bacterium GW2011_GWA2_44_16]KKT83550.1 MAG: Cell division protein ftsA [candidate division WWE3 bacterium GW2011_GWC2_44_9]OGC51174.1 MAG: cell division protein FtsA [candidate division WWE3 bacterium RIFCSPHIGHO2_01_FULL_43_9]HAZ29872.1 cell division protein FtsA [candidate division WWE3 bacterium]
MPKEKYITAIDAGSTKVLTVVAAVSETKISVVGVSKVPSKGINKAVVVNIDEAVESISQSIDKAEKMAGVSISSVFVTVSGGHIETLNSRGVVAVVPHESSEITPEHVARATEAAQAVSLPSSREIIHVIPRDFIVDGQDGIKDPVGMSGIRLEVETNIIHGLSTSVKNLEKCVKHVGVEVEGLVFTGVASAESALTDTEKELGTVLVDIGGGSTSVIIFLDGAPIYSSVLPVGGKHITSDLAIGLRASLDTAEKIKIKLSNEKLDYMSLARDFDKPQARVTAVSPDEFDVTGYGLETNLISKRLLYSIVDPRLEEIFELVAGEIKKANLTAKLPAGCVLTGGGSLTVGAEKCAKNVLKMPVRIGFPKGVSGLIDDIQSPDSSACVGAIVYASKMIKSASLLNLNSPSGKIGGVVKRLLAKLKSFLP